MNLKKFLKKNQIYFNTVTTLLLGIMAIIVAYNSNVIAEEQTRMSYFENTPDFHLSREYIRDSTGYAKELAVRVSKYGGKAKNISVSIKGYAHLEIIDKESKSINKDVHLNDFFNESYRTGEMDGNIRLLKGLNNNRNFSNFSRIIEKELEENGYPYASVDPLIIVKISYTGFLNNEQQEYYDISFADGILIKENDTKISLFDNLDSSPNSIPISELEDENIQKYINIILNN